MWIAITAAVVTLLVVALVKTGTMSRGLRREHFVELLNGIARRKASARGFELPAPESPAAAASAGIVTSIGVVMLWTVRRDGDVHVHHVSISGRGQPWAFRGMMCAFLLDRLGLKGEDAVSARSPTGVDHLRIEVAVADQPALWEKPLRPVPDNTFRVYILDLCKIRDAIRRTPWDESPFAAEPATR